MAKKNGKSNGIPKKFSDKYLLYQWSVQNPEHEVEFMDKVFRSSRKRKPVTLREDFCGTALLCRHWVEGQERTAIGLDLDPEPLAWGEANNLSEMGKERSKIKLFEMDVRTITNPKVDIACAFNFSYFLFRDLGSLVEYFKIVHKSLKKDGLFFLDIYGGWESQQVMLEPREIESPAGAFTYVWDQAEYNPIDNIALCHIHFKFGKGRKMKRAFTYEWRLYTPKEVSEALLMAGFKDVKVFWDVEDDEEQSKYVAVRKAENQPGWLAYIVGFK